MATTAKKIEAKEALPVWDLTDLYPAIDAPEVGEDIAWGMNKSADFANTYLGKVETLSADALAAAIKEYEQIEECLGKLGSYAQLVYAGDMTTPANAQFYQNTLEALTDCSSDLLFFTLSINRIEEVALQAMLKESAALNHYAPWLRDVRAFRDYQLPDDQEKLLHEKSVTGKSAWNRLFDETLTGLRFPYDGEELSEEEVLDKMTSPDEETRKKAGKSLGKVFGDNIGLFSLITNTLAKDKSIEDKWRGYKRPISSRNMDNQVEDEVVEALISTVRKNYPNLSHRYYALKAKWLGKEKLPYWDRNAPLPKEDNSLYAWDDAVELVLDAYGAFSPQMRTLGQKFFDNNWIDVPVREGKSPGAFAHPTVPSAHPYLLLNYLGKTRDVMTLAHELGHGVHQLLAADQGALMADTPLTLAETASVFGEQLTFRELLKRQDSPAKRKILIAGKVEDMLNTVVRQVAFCEFERQVHDARREGELSADEICDIWMSVQQESLGPIFDFDEEYRYFWTYIPHFIHSPFYVYAYAFGDCLVNSLYAVYMQGMEGFEEKYFTMLRAGGTLRHKELLAPFGLDASKPDFWQQGLSMISDFIDELEAE